MVLRLVMVMLAAFTVAACRESQRDAPSDGARPAQGLTAALPSAIADAEPRPASSVILAQPSPLSPVDEEVFDHFPRHSVLVWRDLTGAESYIVEVEYCFPPSCEQGGARQLVRALVKGNAYAFDFVGAQTGRWRVQAVDADGAVGPLSSWSTFAFRR